jgi:hypothetical protein
VTIFLFSHLTPTQLGNGPLLLLGYSLKLYRNGPQRKHRLRSYTVAWRHHRNGPQRKHRSLLLLLVSPLLRNVLPLLTLLAHSVHVTILWDTEEKYYISWDIDKKSFEMLWVINKKCYELSKGFNEEYNALLESKTCKSTVLLFRCSGGSLLLGWVT